MKLYCQCGVFVAEVLPGSNIRRGAKMLCKNCSAKFKIAMQIVDMAAKTRSKSTDIPSIFEQWFGKNKY